MIIISPWFNPIAFQIGGWPIYWYGLAYLISIFIVERYIIWMVRQFHRSLSPEMIPDVVRVFGVLSIIIGGRLGHVIFYEPQYYAAHPFEIIKIWEGGMAFHGALMGVICGMLLFCYQRGVSLFELADLAALSTPVGLFLGRITNFINAELYGRITDVSWGVVFPGAGPWPRHPSQIYEALLEGLLLFICLNGLNYLYNLRKRLPGALSSLFLIGYGGARLIGELFRAPQRDIHFGSFSLDIGQILSLVMIGGGLGLFFFIFRSSARSSL